MTRRGVSGRTGGSAMRVLFMAAFVVASVGLLVGFRESVLLAAGWAIAVMLVYAAVTWLRFPDLVRTEDFADSFYYLGFLLTLVALIGVLIHLGDLTGDNLLEGVLRHFGIALATTVVGLLGRVLIVMFGRAPADFEEAARTKAEQAYDSLTRSLDRMAAEAESFGSGLATRLDTALGPIEPAVQRMVSSADRAAAGLEPLHEALTSFTRSLDAARTAVGDAATSLGGRLDEVGEQSAGQVAAIVTELRALLTPIGQAVRVLEQDIGATRGRLDQSTARFEQRLAATASAMTDVVASLGTLTDQIARLTDDSGQSLRGLRADAERLHAQITLVAGGLAGLASAIDDQQASVRDNVARWDETVSALVAVHGRLIEQVEASNGAAAAVRAEVAEGVRFLRLALGEPPDGPADA